MKYHIFYISAVVVCSFFLGFRVFAIGVSPSLIKIPSLNVASRAERQLTIIRRNVARTEYIHVGVQGEGARALVLPYENFELPQGQRETPYIFSIIPDQSMNGIFEATLIFSTASLAKEDGTSTAVSTGVAVPVRFHVNDTIVQAFEIQQIIASEVEAGRPIAFSFFMKNQGNVQIRPSYITLALQEKNTPDNALQETIEGSFLAPVDPSQAQEVRVTSHLRPPAGEYRGVLTFFLGSIPVYEKKDIIFHVTGKGEGSKKPSLLTPSWWQRFIHFFSKGSV